MSSIVEITLGNMVLLGDDEDVVGAYRRRARRLWWRIVRLRSMRSRPRGDCRPHLRLTKLFGLVRGDSG